MQQFYPYDLGELVEEADLKSRLILPILQSLFDSDGDNVMYFKTNSSNDYESETNDS